MRPEPITNMDAAILNVEDPTAPDTMGLLLLFDGKLNEKELLERIEQNWLQYPRYRQRIRRRSLGRMEWVEDRNFDLRSHFRRVAVPSPHDQGALSRTVGELMAMLLDRSKPLWTMHLIEGGPEGDALLIRVHHAIGDGVTLLKTGLSLFKAEPPPPPPRKLFIERLIEPIAEAVETTQAVRGWLKEQRMQGLPKAADLLARAEKVTELAVKLFPLIQDPRTILTGPLSRRKAVAWTPPVPTLEIKRVARAFDVTVNDLMLAVIAGGLRRYFIEQGERVPKVLHASVPVYLSQTLKTGNNFGLVLAPLPIGEPDPRERIMKIHQAMERLKQSPEAAITASVFNTAGRFPSGLVSRMFMEVSRKASLIVTNVPGSPHKLKLAGATLEHVVPLVPLSGDIGLGIAIASYNRHLSLGIQADRERIKPNMRAFIELLRAEFALLTALADEEVSPRSEHQQCAALTLKGTRCRNRARKGHMTCAAHAELEETLRETTVDGRTTLVEG